MPRLQEVVSRSLLASPFIDGIETCTNEEKRKGKTGKQPSEYATGRNEKCPKKNNRP